MLSVVPPPPSSRPVVTAPRQPPAPTNTPTPSSTRRRPSFGTGAADSRSTSTGRTRDARRAAVNAASCATTAASTGVAQGATGPTARANDPGSTSPSTSTRCRSIATPIPPGTPSSAAATVTSRTSTAIIRRICPFVAATARSRPISVSRPATASVSVPETTKPATNRPSTPNVPTREESVDAGDGTSQNSASARPAPEATTSDPASSPYSAETASSTCRRRASVSADSFASMPMARTGCSESASRSASRAVWNTAYWRASGRGGSATPETSYGRSPSDPWSRTVSPTPAPRCPARAPSSTTSASSAGARPCRRVKGPRTALSHECPRNGPSQGASTGLPEASTAVVGKDSSGTARLTDGNLSSDVRSSSARGMNGCPATTTSVPA